MIFDALIFDALLGGEKYPNVRLTTKIRIYDEDMSAYLEIAGVFAVEYSNFAYPPDSLILVRPDTIGSLRNSTIHLPPAPTREQFMEAVAFLVDSAAGKSPPVPLWQ